METIVDQLKTVNSKSFLNEIKNPSNITILILKNFNNETNWDEISKFTQLNEIQLENCLIDNNIFFKAIAKIQSLTTLKYDYDCIIKKSDIKINLKIPQLNRIVFTLPSKDSPNLSMISFYDRENELNNFVNAFPNYPNAYQGLNEIELINYDIFLQNIKEQDYDYAYTGIYEGKDIFFQCDIYNLLRLKNLKNIKLTELDEEIFEKKIIFEKLLSLPNTDKININNKKISKYRESITKSKTLLLDYEYLEAEERNRTQVKKHEKLKDTLEVHWPSQHYNGYSNIFNEIIKSKLDHVIINTVGSFLDDHFEYFESTYEFISEKIIKNKSIKKITLEFDINDFWETGSRICSEYSIRLIKEIIEKKILCSINFKNLRSFDDFDFNYHKFIEIFKFFLNCQDKDTYKKFIEIKNLKNSDIEKFVDEIYLNEIKSIIVIDDQSNSETLKKFKDIELLDIDLQDPYYLAIFEGPIDFDKLKKKSEESFKEFYNYDFFEGSWTGPNFEKNPGCCVPIIKKSFLDQSKKMIFNNLETINFFYVDKESYPNHEKLFKNKAFHYPKSINYSKVKKFGILSSPPCSLNSLKILENLEDLHFNNYVNQKDTLCWELPTFKNLKKLSLTTRYPFMEDNKSNETKKVINIDKSNKLEDINLDIGVSYNHEETRWNTTDVDLTNFSNLKNLKKLEIRSIDQTLIKNLSNLENLEDLEIVNPFMITKDKNSDDGTIHEPLTENDFDFLKDSKKLRKLKIYFPRFSDEKINITISKFLNLLNQDLEEIMISCDYAEEELNLVHEWYNGLITKFKKIKKISLSVQCNGCEIEHEYNSDYNSPFQKEKRRREKNAKNPIILDFKKISNIKNMQELHFSFDENIGTRLKNTIELANTSLNLKIGSAEKNISIEELEELFNKVATKKQKFLMNLQRKNLDKDIKSYTLEGKEEEEYNQIENEEESKLQINSNNIFENLEIRLKEKKENKK